MSTSAGKSYVGQIELQTNQNSSETKARGEKREKMSVACAKWNSKPIRIRRKYKSRVSSAGKFQSRGSNETINQSELGENARLGPRVRIVGSDLKT